MNKIATGIAVTMVWLLLLEGASRLVLSSVYNRDFDPTVYDDKHHRLTANYQGKFWGDTFTTNQFGCRISAKPFQRTKPTKVYLGDSVTMGAGVADSNTFTYRLSANDTGINVVNASFIGWSVADYRQWIEDQLGPGEPVDDTVNAVTICWCLNDVYGDKRSDELPAIGNKGWISSANEYLRLSAIYRLIKLFVYPNRDHYYQYDRQFYQPTHPLFQNAVANIMAIDSVCKQHDVKLELLLIPYRSQAVSADYHPQELLAQALQNAGISCRTVKFSKSTSRLYYLFADEIHLSDEGHRQLAGWLQ